MKPLPGALRARILEQPSLHVFEGVLIEFSHPSDLQAARCSPGMRKHFERIISPRHVVISSKQVASILKTLARRGVHCHPVEQETQRKKKRTHFYRTETLRPTGRSISMRTLLEKHIQLQQALDIFYRVPGYQAERRRITPLLIELRGEHLYLSAYCQNRRANRLFRLDRMEIPGTY